MWLYKAKDTFKQKKRQPRYRKGKEFHKLHPRYWNNVQSKGRSQETIKKTNNTIKDWYAYLYR